MEQQLLEQQVLLPRLLLLPSDVPVILAMILAQLLHVVVATAGVQIRYFHCVRFRPLRSKGFGLAWTGEISGSFVLCKKKVDQNTKNPDLSELWGHKS